MVDWHAEGRCLCCQTTAAAQQPASDLALGNLDATALQQQAVGPAGLMCFVWLSLAVWPVVLCCLQSLQKIDVQIYGSAQQGNVVTISLCRALISKLTGMLSTAMW